MEYNTQKKKLLLPEYGRNIQKMVDYLLTIEDREERTRAAKTVIDVMGNLYPHLRDVPDFRHKLWDHLAIMSEFKLDIDTPYPLPSLSKLQEKPERLPYSSNHIKYKHYGKLVEKLIDKIKELEDPEQKRALIVLTANHMKKSFLTWNKDSVEDEQIYNDTNTLCGCTVILPAGMTLSNPNDLRTKAHIYLYFITFCVLCHIHLLHKPIFCALHICFAFFKKRLCVFDKKTAISLRSRKNPPIFREKYYFSM